LTPNGKVDRRALGVSIGRSVARTNEPSLPRSSTEAELACVWAEVLGLPSVGIHDDFFDLGGHSLLALKLIAAIQRRFGVLLPLGTLFARPTVADLAPQLTGPTIPEDDCANRGFRGAGAGAPLFHIPGLLGIEFLPPSLAQAVGQVRPYFDALQYPGVDGRRPPSVRVEEIARELVAQIRAVWPDRPCCLSGQSFGGVVAFEVARQLEAVGQPVEFVLLFDSFLPGGHRRRGARELLRVLIDRARHQPPGRRAWFLAQLVFFKLRHTGQRALERLRPKPRVRTSDATPLAAAEKNELSLRLLRGSQAAFDAYQPQPWGGHVILFQAQQISPHFWLRHEPAPSNGWRDFARGSLVVYEFTVEHHELFLEPIASEVIQKTIDVLASVHARRRPSELTAIPLAVR
jgi:thioesterase domain-containing protein